MAKFRIAPIKVPTPIITAYLNQYIEIYASDPIQLPAGGVDPNNTLYWSTSAEVTQLKSYRNYQTGQVVIKQGFKFKVRYRRDKNIQNGMLIYYRGNWFVIDSYEPDVQYNQYVTFDGITNNEGNLVTT